MRKARLAAIINMCYSAMGCRLVWESGSAFWNRPWKFVRRDREYEQNSKSFGVLQNRRRMIIVGWLKNSGMAYPEFLKKESPFTVNDLLSDLPKLKPGLGSSEYRTKTWSKCVSETEVRTVDDVLTLHKSRPNKERDIEIYKRAIELWNDGHKRLNYNDLPEELKTHKNRHSFVDRFKVVEGDESCCHTQ